MTNALLSVLLSFVFATVIGSLLAYALQHKNWLRQQQVSSHEKRIADLTNILVDLDATLNKRLYWTRRLLYAVRRPEKDRLLKAITKYDEAITEWNEKRNLFQIRLAGIVGVFAWQDFEHNLAPRLIGIGSELETLVRNKASSQRQRLVELEQQLNLLSRSIYEFVRTIYRAIQNEERAFYSLARSRRLPKNEDELALVSTWFLLKALLIPLRVEGE